MLMSGPICPDCKMFDITSFTEKGKKKYRCTFCNWEGDPLPRIGLSVHQLRTYRKEQKKDIEQRKKGKLFFIRVYVEKAGDIMDVESVWMWLMETLKLEHLDDPGHEPPYFFFKVKEKPTEKIINHIKGFKGVISVRVD